MRSFIAAAALSAVAATSASSVQYPFFGSWLPAPRAGGAACADFTSCGDCTSSGKLLKCRWCPLANDNSCHAAGSLENKCSASQQIVDPAACAALPPAPAPVPAAMRKPVVIVPGIVGSNLQATLDKPSVPQPLCTKKQSKWFYLWLESFEIAPDAVKCMLDNLKLKHLGNGTCANNDGVTTRIDDYGGLGDINCAMPNALCKTTKNWIEVTDALAAAGYVSGVDMFGAPFDWRYGPKTWMTREFPALQALVERAYNDANGTKVLLTSISLGGPYLHLFLTQFVSQAWKDQHLDSWLSISSLWSGAAEVVQMLTSGMVWGGANWITPLMFQGMVANWPSLAFMLPHAYTSAKDGQYVDSAFATAPNATNSTTTYKSSNMRQMLLDAGRNDTAEILSSIGQYVTSTTQPGLKVHCWYGTNVNTTVGMAWGTTDLTAQPVVQIGNGDGTVHHASLRVCSDWVGRAEHETVVRVWENVSHTGFQTDPEALAAIVAIATGANDTAAQ